ncbi:sacsin-like [Argopecten irradians]|uniref:sacsin-like n=1 Tax=Argopecten irradians TaxID=31199 RepID=UPI003717E2B8
MSSSQTNDTPPPTDEDYDSTDSQVCMDTPTLLQQLKGILDKYQDVQIIRELVQNADDANASEMKIMYIDNNTEKLPDDGDYSNYFRAPALCVFNDAVFSEQDWEFIKSIYKSGKREDCLKVGRFGLGFKSVFHMTDHPVIISHDRAMIIDPCRSSKASSNDCHVLTFKKLRNHAKQKPHYKQARSAIASVYGYFGFTERSLEHRYSGSIFWFSLRRHPSDLSTNVFVRDEITEVMTMFKKEASCLLLFLKNVCHVSFSDQDDPSISFSIKCDVIEQKEKDNFNTKVIECKGVSPDDNTKALFRANISVKDGEHLQKQLWVICNYIKGRKHLSTELRSLAEDKRLSYSPFVGLAVPVDGTPDVQFHGQVFCFLPLPKTDENHTGFPVHVNGFFALGEDRHHVKWPPIDQSERVDDAQKWNHLLCEEVLVDAYADTVEYIRNLTLDNDQNHCDANVVYNILPVQENVRPNWDIIVDPLYTCLKHSAIFYTKNNRGMWIQAKDAILSKLQWDEDGIEKDTIKQAEQCIFDLLLQYEQHIVKVPSHVSKKFPELRRITPQYLRSVMRESQIYSSLPVSQKLLILQFILTDGQYDDLDGLQLLPLEDDTFGIFGKGNTVYICSAKEIKMFPGIERNFIKLDIHQNTRKHLINIQKAGRFNLKNLNKEDFPNLLSSTLSANGKFQTDGRFRSSTSHISMTWLDLVWSFIDRECDITPSLEKLCLVPIIDDSQSEENLDLLPLKGLYLVADCGGMVPLTPTLRRALGRLGITVISHITKGETLDHLMDSYCKYPNLKGLMELLEKLFQNYQSNTLSQTEMISSFKDQSTSQEKTDLLNFLSQDCHQSFPGADAVLKELDIFPEILYQNTKARYTSIAKNKCMECENSIPVRYPLPLLHLDSNQKVLAKRLGAKELSEKLLIQKILQAVIDGNPEYDEPSVERFMMYTLRFCSSLSSSVDLDAIIGLGSRVKFIIMPSTPYDSELVPISAFFDHTNSILQKLFHFEQSKFLPEQYQQEELVSTLRKFGLKSDTDIKQGDGFDVVKTLDRKCKENDQNNLEDIRSCSRQLMETLDKLLESSEANIDSILGYQWVTFIDRKPVHYPDILPWYGETVKSFLCSPQEATLTKYESLAASIRCIVETSNYPNLAVKCKWNNPPDVDMCFRQLDTVRDAFCPQHKAKLNAVTKDIYQHLSSLEDVVVKSRPIVCTGKGFHCPKEVFISFPFDTNISLEPFMYKLPDEFLEYSDLFVKLGSTRTHTISSLNAVLVSMKECSGTSSCVKDRDRRIAVDILDMIAILKGKSDDNLTETLVPVQSHNGELDLRLVNECTYSDSDSSWLQDGDEDDDVRYVHPDVSAELAEKLGVMTFTQRFLSDGGTDEIESYGQSEPLTTSLKRLLENYCDGLAVFKELIQNADDAGAQEICFLYDERQNENARTGLIDANMAQCQGPAFWTYNDAKFTDSDFENIIKLGGGTKRAKKTKIGKFGLGFSAVYNLTDVPSFVSGHSLVVFDPHTTHLGKAIKNKNNPGIRLTFRAKSAGMLKRIRNQFLPYNDIFGCDLSGSTMPPYYDGTLFRLPLRTREQAIRSEIKGQPYRKEDMAELLHLLKDCAGDLLTFTQNLKGIRLFHLSENSVNPAKDMELVFCTKKSVIQTNPTHADSGSVMSRAENVCTTKKFECTELISVNVSTFRNSLLNMREEKSPRPTLRIVSWASGTTSETLEMAKQLESDGALNLGSVAVSLTETPGSIRVAVPFPHEDEHLGFYGCSHFFCFLPLPVECKTPVHINGCFSVSSDRKGLIKSTSDEKGITTKENWNRMLLTDAVCNANLDLVKSLEHFKVELHPEYSSLWPAADDPIVTCLSDAFCKAIVYKGHNVFYTPERRHRVSFRGSIFLDSKLRHDKTVGDFAFETFKNLYEGENEPMDMSLSLQRQFCKADCEKELLEQTMSTEDFYEDIFFPNIQNVEEKKRDALVMHILKTSCLFLQNLLKNHPCIPVSANGKLRPPRELVRPETVLSKLFFDEDGRFPLDRNEPFSSEANLNALVELGMMDSTLPDEILLERAESISCLNEHKHATQRCRHLLAYISKHNVACKNIFDQLCRTSFIPSLKKPKHWPLTWFSDEQDTFSPPNEMYFPEHMDRIACTKLIVNVEELRCDFNVCLVLESLGVKHEELQEDVEAQLLAIGEHGEIPPGKQRRRLFEICISVYEYFDAPSKRLSGKFEDLPVILISEYQLVPPRKITTERFSRIDCAPEIYQIDSADVKRFQRFLKLVGVREQLCKEDVILALERVTAKDVKCDDNESIGLIVNLLRLLANVCKRRYEKLEQEEISRVCVPDDTCTLRSVNALCVDDGFLLKRQPYMHFVHATVSGEIIKLLDIKSKRVKHLNAIKGSMPFGQKEELVTRLKGILQEYPENETILYELLQNADDAGAKEIKFVLDMRQHQTKKGIFGESWADVQGPALCVFNDSCFSEEDLEGICKLGQGSKSQDPTKTGQFGIGFNAVYHLTDTPSFITRGPVTPNKGTFCAFDPNCAFCPAADELNPGIQIPDLAELEEYYPGVYDCYLQKEMPRDQGTWFRFPLRTEKMAKKSGICEKKRDSLDELLHSFKVNMKKCLLFLRSVREISLCKIDSKGNFLDNHRVTASLERDQENDLNVFYNNCDKLTKSVFSKSKGIGEIAKQSIQYIMTTHEESKLSERWIIAQTFGFDPDTKIPDVIQEAFTNNDIALTPKGAVALPYPTEITESGQRDIDAPYDSHSTNRKKHNPVVLPGVHEDMNIEDIYDIQTDDHSTDSGFGQIFCFLPLPLKSGLPVHINGHFALHQTRTGMWEGNSMRGFWNSLLFETSIANSYVLAIEYMRDTYEKDTEGQDLDEVHIKSLLSKYHDAFPRYDQGKNDLIKNMITSLFSMLYENESTVFPVLSTTLKPIWWVGLQQSNDNHAFPAFFDDLSIQFEAELRIPSYVVVTEVDQVKQNRLKQQQAVSDALKLSSTLKAIGMKVLETPLWIFTSMKLAFLKKKNLCISSTMHKEFKEEIHILNPLIIVKFLSQESGSSPDACLLNDVDQNISETPIKSVENTRHLLRYCLKDHDMFLQHVDSLPLLITNDCKLRRFSPKRPVYLSEFWDLLPASSEQFVHKDLVKLIQCIARSPSLKDFDLDCFARLLPGSIDTGLLSNDEPIQWNYQLLPKYWLNRFWQFMDTLKTKSINIEVLQKWCLLPGQLKTGAPDRDILVPFHMGFVLMDITLFDEPLSDNLASLEIPLPHPLCMNTQMMNFVASKRDPVHFIKSLHYHKEKVRTLQLNGCKNILHHIASNAKQLDLGIEGKLRQLPLFLTVDGQTVDLLPNRRVFIVESSSSSDLPTDGLGDWSNACEVRLLKYYFPTSGLMHFLGYDRTLSETDLYTNLILPHFFHIKDEYRLLHLEFVRDHLLRMSHESPLKNALQNSAFVLHEGKLKKANSFFSPHVRFLKKMCDQSMLPPTPFQESKWKEFMEYAGMKTNVTTVLYCQFAKQIEQHGLCSMTDEIKSKSEVMVKYLFETNQLSSNRGFLQDIKDIRFVVPQPVEEEYSQVFTQFGNGNLISFSGSILSHLIHIVWTTKLILPRYLGFLHLDDHILDALGVLREPPLRDVLSHTHNICDNLNRRLRDKNTNKNARYLSNVFITTLMSEIYDYLQEHRGNIEEIKRMLSETPLVHMDEMNIFVKAKQVSISFCETKPIPPYLVKIPLIYGKYKDLFLVAGTTESVTIYQYSDVLYHIKAEVQTEILGPDHTQHVLEALTGLMTLLEGMDEASIKDSMDDIETLYLPTSKKTLANSKELVINDNKTLQKRLDRGKNHQIIFMHSVKECQRKEDLLLKLPVRLRPRALTTIIQKCLVSANVNNESDTNVDLLQKFVHSSRFLRVVEKIGKFEDFTSYRQHLLDVRFVSVSEIRTILSLDSKRIAGTEMTEECYYSTDERIFYIANCAKNIRTWLKKIGKELFGLLSNCLAKQITPEKIRELVDYMDDKEGFKEYFRKLLDEDDDEEEESLLYRPGQLVPIGLHALLQQGDITLEVGDLVAYEKYDEEIDGRVNNSFGDENCHAVYVFVKIVKKLTESELGRYFDTYKVQTGQDEEKEVLGLRLYKVIYPEQSSTTDLVMHEFGHDSIGPHKRDEIFDQIITVLSHAWTLKEADRKRVVKRLLLLYHPDKNRNRGDEYERFCTEVTAFILDIIRRLEKGETFHQFSEPSSSNQRGRQRWKRNRPRQRYDNWQYGEDLPKVWCSFRNRMSSRYTYTQTNFRWYHQQRGQYIPNPQPQEAQRWYIQACMDFRSGKTSLNSRNTTENGDQSREEDCNWICFKFHQACEKACKAYMYSIDAEKVSKTHYLPNILSYGSIDGLDNVLREIETLVGSYSRMRYPNVTDIPNIPGTLYTQDQAEKLMELTEKVIEKIQSQL